MDSARRRTFIIAEVTAIVVAVAAGAFLGVRARNGDDGEQADALPAAVAAATTAPGTAAATAPTSVTVPATTVAATTATPTSPTTLPTTTLPTTTQPATTQPATTQPAPTTTVAPAPTLPTMFDTELEAALIAALPTTADLGEGWTALPEGPRGSLLIARDTEGYCNGPNADRRALDAGATAAATFMAVQPNGGEYEVRLIGFETAAGAQEFLDVTRSQIDSCDGSYGSVRPEGDGLNGTFDGFDGADPDVSWLVSGGVAHQTQEFTGVDDAMRIAAVRGYSTTLDGVEYGWKDSRIVQYERIGRVIINHRVYGSHDLVGWDDVEGYDYDPSEQDLIMATIVFTEPLFRGLLEQELISVPT